MFNRSQTVRRKLLIPGVALVAFLVLVFIGYRELNHNYYEAITVTGATPLALYTSVPADFHIEVTGDVKKVYAFGSSALRAFATTRIRTKEVSATSSSSIFPGIWNLLELNTEPQNLLHI